MIYQALCKHLHQQPTLSLSKLVPVLTDSQLALIQEQSLWQQIKNVVTKVYSIADDDTRLRSLAKNSLSGGISFSAGFDDLRKTYPIRREFNNYYIDPLTVKDQSTKDWLTILCFHV